MKFSDVVSVIGKVPITRPQDGKLLYDFVCRAGVRDILELGFAHGTSTCYLAAALDESAEGHIVTIDNQTALKRRPSLPELLTRLNLERYVTPVFSQTSYNWELLRLIEKQTTGDKCDPLFDFCFIDGAHLWEPDGFAFFLVDKLLKPGGWILFDDLAWTIASSPTVRNRPAMKVLPDDQLRCTQVERIFCLLVAQHGSYGNLTIRGNWGWAQKRSVGGEITAPLKNSVNDTYDDRGVREDILALLRKMHRNLTRKRAGLYRLFDRLS